PQPRAPLGAHVGAWRALPRFDHDLLLHAYPCRVLAPEARHLPNPRVGCPFRVAALFSDDGIELRRKPGAHVSARVDPRPLVPRGERRRYADSSRIEFPHQQSLELSGARMSRPEEPRVAVVHEWLLDYAGSERVLREILEIFPG